MKAKYHRWLAAEHVSARSWFLGMLASVVECIDNKQPNYGISYKTFVELYGDQMARKTKSTMVREGYIYLKDGVMFPTPELTERIRRVK